MSQLITPGQHLSLTKTIKSVLGNHAINSTHAACTYVVNQLLGCQLNSTVDLTRQQWKQFRNAAFPGWDENDWTLSPAYESRIAAVANEYREQVLGQRRLF